MREMILAKINGLTGPAAFIAVMVIIGPFNTLGDLTLLERIGYWTATALAGGIGALALFPSLEKHLTRNWPRAPALMAKAIVLSLPLTATVLILEAHLRVPLPPLHWPVLFAMVLTVAFVMTAIHARRAARTTEPEATRPTGPSQPRFAARLPKIMQDAPIWALKAEDHYLRVYTAKGDALILARLSDAAAELADGLQPHRSWWVAIEAVAREERDGAKRHLVLKNGVAVPVSRARQKAVTAQLLPTRA